MECREFVRLIPQFIKGKMDYRTLKSFQAHYESCDECREELVIQFLVTEGMARLEEGSSFDLQGELDKRLDAARQKVRRNDRIMNVGTALELVYIMLIGAAVMWIVWN